LEENNHGLELKVIKIIYFFIKFMGVFFHKQTGYSIVKSDCLAR